ncbi:translation initiation factor [Parapedobacter sp. 10938]|uniref:translation initiation factor n=1 Tax=Parapedobacter flavus TaxID=3110225 RepID=UPI002DBD1533|nr:translation initiation factor [Parapedobacter sp. 10938]MEC3880735.1 translation initiation factor [Parapedobacter sp. 10938]
MKRKQQYNGIVYSTAEDFAFQEIETDEVTTLPNRQQDLRVMLDRKMRGGKTVTLVKGFVGAAADLEALGKKLKQKCGVGGSAKDSEIIVQGDFKHRIVQLLLDEGYRVKPVGG